MASFSSRFKQIRFYQWLLAALVLFYLIYIALSYLYLPNKLKQIVETDVSELIGRNIEVEQFDFNPFVLSLKVVRFSIEDKPKKPLMGWQQLFVDFSFWKSLFSWEIALDEFVLDQPEINIEKYRDRFNFSDIIERLSSEEAPEATSKGQLMEDRPMALEIFHTAINRGIFRFTDLSSNQPAPFNLDNISVEVEALYIATGDKHLNPFDIKAKIPGGGNLRLSGQYRIDPLYVDAEVFVREVQLATFSKFVENIIPVKISNGLLSVNTRILAKQETQLELQVSRGQLGITDLALDDDVTDPPMLRGGSIVADDVALDLLQRSMTVESVSLDNISSYQWLDKEGRPRYDRFIKVKAPQQSPPGKAAALPWNILMKHIGLKNSTLNFSDKKDEITRDHSLSEITLDLENFTLKSRSPLSIRLAALLDEQGRISSEGTLTLSPFSMNLNYRLDKILLPPFSEYLENVSFLQIEEGNLTVDGSATLGTGDNQSLNAAINLAVKNFQASDTRKGEDFFSLETLNLDDIRVDTNRQKVSISSISLVKPEVFLEMSENKKINLATLSRTSAPPKVASHDKKPDGVAKWLYKIDKIKLKDGAVHYTDKSVKPVFETGLYDLALSADQIANYKVETIPFLLSSKIDRYAPFSIKGTLEPLDRQPGFTFTSELKGLEMSRLSPYSAIFIGNNLKSGKLSLELDYGLKKHSMKGKNHIVAKNLYLGEKVPSKTAIKAPVALGLVLLRDINGIIDLNVAVSGDLNNPGFSVSGIVLKALVNVFVKAAASPFKLLGSLVGGGEDLGEIDFTAGIAELNQDNQKSLKQLADALTQKPTLAVRIKGNASAQDDTAALQAFRVLEQVAAYRNISTADLQAEAGNRVLWMLSENREVLAKMNDKLKLPSASKRTSQLQAEKPELKNEELETEVYRQIYENITSRQLIGTDELLSLADRRALSIKQHLVDALQLDHKQVSVIKAQKNELTGSVIKMELEAI